MVLPLLPRQPIPSIGWMQSMGWRICLLSILGGHTSVRIFCESFNTANLWDP